jgi:hypothetical protein
VTAGDYTVEMKVDRELFERIRLTELNESESVAFGFKTLLVKEIEEILT